MEMILFATFFVCIVLKHAEIILPAHDCRQADQIENSLISKFGKLLPQKHLNARLPCP